jgi:hypothetical protein
MSSAYFDPEWLTTDAGIDVSDITRTTPARGAGALIDATTPHPYLNYIPSTARWQLCTSGNVWHAQSFVCNPENLWRQRARQTIN